jgi:YidC/Oxa1 family membrane protein insertase
MDKKSLLAIALSILILVGYQELVSYLYPPPPPTQQSAQSPMPPAPVVTAPQPGTEEKAHSTETKEAPLSSATGAAAPTVRMVTVENDVYGCVHVVRRTFTKVRLKQYPGDAGKDSPPREMVVEGTNGEFPLEFRLEGKDLILSDETVHYETSNNDVHIQGESQATIVFNGKMPNGTRITKTFSFSGQTYGMTLTVALEGAPEAANFASLVWTHGAEPNRSSSGQHGPVALVDRKFVYESSANLKKEEKDLGPGHIRWGGYTDTYFLAAMLPPEGDFIHFFLNVNQGTIDEKLTIPWNRESVSYTIYVGPKDFAALNAVSPTLDRAIDFGWFHLIARPLVYVLRFSHSLTGNYGIDIILLTLLVKLAFFPF